MSPYTDYDPAADDGAAEAFWSAGGVADPVAANVFTEEIENVSESDWDTVDSDLLWGADTDGDAPHHDIDPSGPDFLV